MCRRTSANKGLGWALNPGLSDSEACALRSAIVLCAAKVTESCYGGECSGEKVLTGWGPFLIHWNSRNRCLLAFPTHWLLQHLAENLGCDLGEV